jgi:hypothetical protein
MNTKQETNQRLMAHWAQAWTTLGRWQALNSRLSKETPPLESGWTRPAAATGEWRRGISSDRPVAVSASSR